MSGPIAQIFSLGILWTSLHCSGMSGPFVTGLDVAGVGRGLGASRGVARIFAYQLGRLTVLGPLGALSGLFGRGLKSAFEPLAAGFALAFGVAILIVAASRWRGRRQASAAAPEVSRPLSLERRPSAPSRITQWRQRVGHRLRMLSLSNHWSAAWLTGVLLGFLPCMIVLWALGLAATSGSPWEGALVMASLMLITTPVLIGITLLPRALRRWIPLGIRKHLPELALAISGVWVILAALASLGVIAHRHVGIGAYMIMFW